MSSYSEAEKFATMHGYTHIEFRDEWNGFDVYDFFTEGDIDADIGLPIFILVRGSSARFSTVDEAFAFIDRSDNA